MVTYFKLEKDAKMTDAQNREIEEAAKRPIVFDEDSPEMTPAMEAAFLEERKKRPFKSEQITISLPVNTVERAEELFGEDYSAALGKLLDKAVREYVVQ